MKFLIALTLSLVSINKVHAQDTVCIGMKCRPVEVINGNNSNESTGSQLDNYGGYKSGVRNRHASRPAHEEVVEKAKKPNEVTLFRPQMESSSSLKIQNLNLGMCMINPNDQSAFYKIVELNKSSGMIRYVKENEVHNNELHATIVFFHNTEANSLKSMKVWPCENTPNLSDEEYVRKCTKDVVAGGTHFCNGRSQITGKIVE